MNSFHRFLSNNTRLVHYLDHRHFDYPLHRRSHRDPSVIGEIQP